MDTKIIKLTQIEHFWIVMRQISDEEYSVTIYHSDISDEGFLDAAYARSLSLEEQKFKVMVRECKRGLEQAYLARSRMK